MTITKLSSREFNQDTSRAKRAATKGPVIITDRGRPAHVLPIFSDHQRLTLETSSVMDLPGLPLGARMWSWRSRCCAITPPISPLG